MPFQDPHRIAHSGKEDRIAATLAILAFIAAAGASDAEKPPLDLARAVIVTPEHASKPVARAVALFTSAIRERTRLEIPTQHSWPAGDVPVIAIGPAGWVRELGHQSSSGLTNSREVLRELGDVPKKPKPEGYRIRASREGPAVVVAGNDARGVLFGAGRLLRELRMAPGRLTLPNVLRIDTAPKYPLRGHQLGYRPKTNSYDAWDLDQWERYIGELAVFGTNAIELIPPRSDDAADSPHFPRPPLEMMVGMSQICADYGLDVWIWYPAMDADYNDANTVAAALKEWGEVFEKLPRIDAVFVPGGDPGHTRPKVLFALLEKEAEVLHRSHPKAQMWMSPQSFDQEWLEEFLALMNAQPKWLDGIVFGPQVRISLPELRAAIPQRYPIRHYPDITHSLQCQYPVPDWDLAFALTENREVINPRPLGEASICRTLSPFTNGFLTYSEGCNDDVNKFVWSALGWDPDAEVLDILREYSRLFVGEEQGEGFAQGLLALESNWQGPLLNNSGVETTLAQFRDMERAASPRVRQNWRFQQGLYRAYYDAHLRDRLIYETALESRALDALRQAKKLGAKQAMSRASEILGEAVLLPVSTDRRARVFELAEALFQSIQMQLSVPRYGAISVDRGANLDLIDVPLNSRVWLEQQFKDIAALENEAERLRALDALVNRTDPGPGGFYDALGDLTWQTHLVRGVGVAADPAFLCSSLVGFGRRSGWPMAWCRNAQSLNDAPLAMHYDGLDPHARYKVRVVYAGDSLRKKIRLDADSVPVHPLIAKPNPVRPVEFDIPREATSDGSLTLQWHQEPGLGGNGRGCQVSEVWLMRAASDGR